MKKQVKLTVKETTATNRDFYNLFRPIAPSIDVIGKAAQVVSALTEAITIWFITQSEMANTSKTVSIVVSILATLLVVAVLELGGRKFLQVATRAIVWKRLKNAWYKTLFVIVTLITIGMGIISFRLSTNGIHHAFVSNVTVPNLFDDSAYKKEYKENIKEIKTRFDGELTLLKERHQESVTSMTAQFDARINAAQIKLEDYDYRDKKGMSWAKSHVEKYRNKIGTINTDKTATLASLKEDYNQKVDAWQNRKNKALETEKAVLAANVAKAEKVIGKKHQFKSKNAEFWGVLFSYFVGFSVVLAFICIVTVEVYRRGAGIEIEYDEEEKDDSILGLFWYGLTKRLDNFFRTRAERFAKVSRTSGSNRSIGFNHSSAFGTAQTESNLPRAEYENGTNF